MSLFVTGHWQPGIFSVVLNLQRRRKATYLAMDLFPAQPFSYLSKGRALQLQGKHQEAIDILEIGIDFIIENPLLEAQFYTILVDVYTSLNKTSKALEYKMKLKNDKI